MNNAEDRIDEPRPKRSIGRAIRLLCIIVGLCCCLQFFVVGIVGVYRGYSVQSDAPKQIMLAGVYLLMIESFSYWQIARKLRKDKDPIMQKNAAKAHRRGTVLLCVSFLVYICPIIITQHRGNHHGRGEAYYERRQYEDALKEFAAEVDTWYLRFGDNSWWEPRAVGMMAETYCQLGEFEKAGEQYRLLKGRYTEYYKSRHYISSRTARKRTRQLKNGLVKIKDFQDMDPESSGYTRQLFDLAMCYRHDLRCDAKALEVYGQLLDMDISEELKEIAFEEAVELSGFKSVDAGDGQVSVVDSILNKAARLEPRPPAG